MIAAMPPILPPPHRAKPAPVKACTVAVGERAIRIAYQGETL